MIDAHQHFWKYDANRHDWITDDMQRIRRDFQPEHLKPYLDKHGFEGCVLVQVDQTEDETVQLLLLADANDFIRGVVGWVDLRSENLATALTHYAGHQKLKGFRHIIQAEAPGFMDQQALVDGVNMLHQWNLTFDLLIYHHQLEEALRFVKNIPDTRIVIDHIAKPSIATHDIGLWEKSMREMAKLPNVFCKVSGMVTEADWSAWKPDDFTPYLEVVADAFGTDRLLYGSDWPVCLVAASYDEQFAIVQRFIEQFTPSEREGILGGNAKRIYNL